MHGFNAKTMFLRYTESMHNYKLLDEKLETLTHVFVDLDGTFVHEELTHDYVKNDIKENPWKAFKYGLQHLIHRRMQKFRLAKLIKTWTVRKELLELLQKHKEHLHITLITGSCTTLGQKIGKKYGDLFDEIIGSTPEHECLGLNKIPHMKKFATNPFYIGNSFQDLPIFNTLKQGCCITSNRKLQTKLNTAEIILIEHK